MVLEQQVEQLFFDGLAPEKKRTKRRQVRQACNHLPVAQVVLDVHAPHLGQTFDYLLDEKDDERAQPGSLVRVRFGGRRVNGIIWNRVEHSDAPVSALKYVERVLTRQVLVSSSTRRDIESIAKAYGGTRANILRLALPPRVARIDNEQSHISQEKQSGELVNLTHGQKQSIESIGSALCQAYSKWELLSEAISGHSFSAFTIDVLPGLHEWEISCLWIIVQAFQAGRSVILVLPDIRHVKRLSLQLDKFGLHRFSPIDDGHTAWVGDYTVLESSMAPADRYRSYLAISQGNVSCVLGTRAAMYAPVEGEAVFAIVDDAAYQNTDGMTPYANARGVLRLRAKLHNGLFLVIGQARSVRSQWEDSAEAVEVSSGVTGPARVIEPTREAVRDHLPWVRWLNRSELARLADPTIGARVPHTAVAALTQAMQTGPVLLSIPHDSQIQVLSCASCFRMARCMLCSGPIIAQSAGHAPRCEWCGHAAVNWSCKECGCDRVRVIRVGATGTAQELRLLFKGVPIVISSPAQPRGVVESIDSKPRLVIATPGAEPSIRQKDGDKDIGYQAVAIVDAWTSLYAWGVDARLDTLTAWMKIISQCKPRQKGGQALILGEAEPELVQALMTWRPDILASAELADRIQTGLSPSVSVASVWGSRTAVDWALDKIGARGDGDIAVLDLGQGHTPSVLGPVEIAPESKLKTQPLDGTVDRVRALVRVVPKQRDQLAYRLHAAVSEYVAARIGGELRFCMDPKDI